MFETETRQEKFFESNYSKDMKDKMLLLHYML